MKKLDKMKAALLDNAPRVADTQKMTPKQSKALKERRRKLGRAGSFRNYQLLAEAFERMNKIVVALKTQIRTNKIRPAKKFKDLVTAESKKAKNAIDRLDV